MIISKFAEMNQIWWQMIIGKNSLDDNKNDNQAMKLPKFRFEAPKSISSVSGKVADLVQHGAKCGRV